MLPELGQILLASALLTALLQTVLPLLGAHRGQTPWMQVARPAALVQLVLVGAAFAVLTAAFLQQDFSVRYVAENSNTLLPTVYRWSAVWGAHEGSLLLWSLVLALWTAAVALASHRLPLPVQARVLAVMGLVSLVLLAIVIAVNVFVARRCGFSKADEITIVFCGSKKSLANGIPMANILFPTSVIGMMVLPLMIFHQIQLMVCAVLARRYKRQTEKLAQEETRAAKA